VIAGHFGFAAVVKSRERTVPLWALMLATAFLDVVFVPLYLAGIERIIPVPGTGGGYGDGIIHADYTHSLVGAVALAVAFGVVAAIPWGRRVGAVLGAVVFSHWVLDLVVHRMDLAILPGAAGGLPRLGFGLWQFPVAAAAVELALVVVGAYLYWRSAVRSAPERGRPSLVAVCLLLAGVVTLGLDVTS
jgi:Kef-type K+ transport system membrane component KefB